MRPGHQPGRPGGAQDGGSAHDEHHPGGRIGVGAFGVAEESGDDHPPGGIALQRDWNRQEAHLADLGLVKDALDWLRGRTHKVGEFLV